MSHERELLRHVSGCIINGNSATSPRSGLLSSGRPADLLGLIGTNQKTHRDMLLATPTKLKSRLHTLDQQLQKSRSRSKRDAAEAQDPDAIISRMQ
jgi:hypothetical protein